MASSIKYHRVAAEVRELLADLTPEERQRLVRELRKENPSPAHRPKGTKTEPGNISRYIQWLRKRARRQLGKEASDEDVAKLAFEISQSEEAREDQVYRFKKVLDLRPDQFKAYHRREE